MSKLNKIKNGEYIGGDKYTITPDAGGKSRVVFSPDNILTEPTPVGAEILNEMQLNQVYTLDTTRSVDGQKEVYIATLEGFTEFDSPDLSFNLKINSENTNSQTYLRLNGIDYLIECKIGNLKAGSIVYAKKVNSVIKVIGNKNFGVVEGDILEGHRMAQSLGVEKFGGDVQTAGTKKVGYAYWCTVNKDMYICKVENSLNYIDASYFEAFSNNALLGKLNNLINLVDYIIETGQTNGWYWTKFKSGKISQMKEYIPKSQYETIELGVPMSNPTISIFGIGKAVQNFNVVGANSATNVIYAEFNGSQLGSSYVRVIAKNYNT